MNSMFALFLAVDLALAGCSAFAKEVKKIEDEGGEVDLGVTAPFGLGLNLRLHMPPKDPEGLTKKIADGVVLTPAQYQEQHGPDPQHVEQVISHLKAHGIEVDSRRGHVLHIRPTVEQAQNAFDTHLLAIKRADGTGGHLATTLPKLPDGFPQVAITGLHTRHAKVSHLRRPEDSAAHRSGQSPITAKVLRRAYNIPADATGSGQTVAMVELDGYDPADLDRYAETMGIRRVPTRNVLVGCNDGQIHDQGARGEVTLDIELASAMAPDLAEIVVYEADNSDHGLNDIFNELANPGEGQPLIKFISCSWGEPEDQMTEDQARAEGLILQQLAAQGQTVFAAAGDSGADDDGQTRGTDDPASQPFVMAVGGTTLQLKGGRYGTETTWTGGGGGVSRFWGSPSWQKGLEKKTTHASLRRRDVPDVALNADPQTGYAVFVGGWQTVGGTSCAAPLWAAFAALVDQKRTASGKAPLGFFPPALYAVAPTDAGRAGLHDIADGSTNGYYPAVLGLDAATGWGTINGEPLLTAFVDH